MTAFHVKTSVPLLPAVDLKETVAFYKDLGFVNIYGSKERAGGYAIMDNDFFNFHLYTYKKLTLPTPTNMHLYELDDVDALYDFFMTQHKDKTAHGKVPPRNGLPRVGIPKTLNADRRFSVTDPNGNHFIFVQPFEKKDHHIQSQFEKLSWESNTLAYSHESPIEAIKMLEAAFKRTKSLEEESPNIVFQAFVLLTDNYLLLEDKETAAHYYEKAHDWINKIERTEDEYLKDALKQFDSFEV